MHHIPFGPGRSRTIYITPVHVVPQSRSEDRAHPSNEWLCSPAVQADDQPCTLRDSL